jgi:hypothetical protein
LGHCAKAGEAARAARRNAERLTLMFHARSIGTPIRRIEKRISGP